ncbi:MAG: hypothetical protein RLY31_1730 [Bacteroidota bacterium]|jgi:hypothetical protein
MQQSIRTVMTRPVLNWSFACLILSLHAIPAWPQAGCTDPMALNFNPLATSNDGSCLYPPAAFAPNQVAILPASLEECSGLAMAGGRLWSHEDGGNPEQLHALDTLDGSVSLTLTIPGLDNTDWEDAATDETYLYVGDFGNNAGNRTDLRIARILKSDLQNGIPIPEIIHFSFSDQTSFQFGYNAHNFDCEAFFAQDDSLHLFSKNWTDFKTRHYVLPAQPGTQVAMLRDSFAVQGQVTGADIRDDGTVVLLGYNVSTSETFLWLLWDYPGHQFFRGNKRKISMGSALFTSQPEGIAFSGPRNGFICSERYSVLPPQLLSFDLTPWLPTPTAVATTGTTRSYWQVHPNPSSSSFLHVQGPPLQTACMLILEDRFGTRLREWKLDSFPGHCRIDLPAALPAGIHFLRMIGQHGFVTLRVLII